MKTTAEMIEQAKKIGVTVMISTAPPKVTGDVVLLPGLHVPTPTS